MGALDELIVSKNKSEEPPKAGEKPKEKSKTEVTVVRVVTLPVHSSSPDQSNNDILNVSPILRPGDKVHNNSSGGSSVMTPEVLWNRISTFQSLVEARLAKLSSKSGEENPSKSTEEGLRELKADLKSEKEVLKLLDNIDEYADTPEEDFNNFRNWRVIQLGIVESLLDMVQDKREECDRLHRAKPRGATPMMFEKMKLPIFTGKSLDYVDFKIKWMDQVHTAGFNELQELANLKDKIPKNATDKMFGITTLEDAWKILDNNYGNRELTVSLLKNKLKNIKPSAKEDHNRVIELKDQLSHLSRRMTAVGGQSLLDSDMDFIASISKHLPDHLRYKWDVVSCETTGSKWMSFSKFMENEADVALHRKITETCLQGSEADVRTDKDAKKCKWCKSPGHLESDC